MIVGQWEFRNISVYHQFTAEKLASHVQVTKNQAQFMIACKTKDTYPKLLDLLALESGPSDHLLLSGKP